MIESLVTEVAFCDYSFPPKSELNFAYIVGVRTKRCSSTRSGDDRNSFKAGHCKIIKNLLITAQFHRLSTETQGFEHHITYAQEKEFGFIIALPFCSLKSIKAWIRLTPTSL